MRLSLYLGDSPTFAIPLTLAGQPFAPGTEWGLIFTAKYDETDDDADAIFQKASGVGIDVVGSKAYVTLVSEDTRNLRPFTGVWDVVAKSVNTGKRFVVASNILTTKRPVGRNDQTSVPIRTTDEPAPFGTGITVTDGIATFVFGGTTFQFAVVPVGGEEGTVITDTDGFGFTDTDGASLIDTGGAGSAVDGALTDSDNSQLTDTDSSILTS